MLNIELKTPLDDRPALEQRLRELGAREEWTREQRDTFFRVPRAMLKLREAAGQAELIAYERATDDARPRPSRYERLPLDADSARRTLSLVLDVEAVVEKERTLWLLRHTRIHLDRICGLGDWLELETVALEIDEAEARAENEALVRDLALDPSRFEARPYRDLLA